MTPGTAIVTLAVGKEHRDRWHRLCEPNWREYAARHDYDVICLEDPLDRSARAASRSVSWQKLLVPGQAFASDYDRLVWLDADVLLGRDAPPIADDVPDHLVGAVDEVATFSPKLRQVVHPDPPSEYRDAGLDCQFTEIVQGGLLVCSPEHHREVFEGVYRDYEDGPATVYEMRPLSYELLSRDLVHWLDPRFNTLWFVYRAENHPGLGHYRRHPKSRPLFRRALEEVHCLHFAGEADQMEFVMGEPGTGRTRSGRDRMRSPVALFVHSRPETTATVLDAVRQARPRRLLVVADGPRDHVNGEAERCESTRALIETVDWPCEVETEYADENLGLKRRVETGLDWVFSQTEEAIVLEDDCVPDQSFFDFCDELLERYRADERVMSIAGTNFQFDRRATADDYYFSRYSLIWGWATWADAWAEHDPEMNAWPELRDSSWLVELLEEPHAAAYWSYVFETTYRDHDTWDRAWMLACWLRGGLHAIPNVNLVRNIGFRVDATHTTPGTGELVADLPTEPIHPPLVHPRTVTRDAAADTALENVLFGGTITDMFSRLRQIRSTAEARA